MEVPDDMNHEVREKVWTVEDLASLPKEGDYEIVDGELIEMGETGLAQARIARAIFFVLAHYAETTGGEAFPNHGFVLRRRPDRFRRPDVDYYAPGRLPEEASPDTAPEIHPDIAVEVLSKNDSVADTHRRVSDLLKAGVRLIWIIDPYSRTAQIYRPDRHVQVVTEDATLDGEDVAPGLRFSLRSVLVKLAREAE